ncbi:MAG TPA: tRNA (adenosine(37)-N6)-threonylcarbamoyltransferase complex ATPase subunit type 1 TsaE, partial [Bacteroidia bacterium]|nr:tRNA (adenosine(37)-N6)-threonylcarbamoyltransferase complex ATPase subunit type 1 TsaE [Bacteroidia bacterium]
MIAAAAQQSENALLASKFINHTQKTIFLTGKAGTGKTTFLRHIVKHTHKKSIIVAPTGIAAINAGGVTIHSLFQLPFGA